METMKKNDEVVIKIEDISAGGEGIGKASGFALFVKDTVPGDLVRTVVTKVKKTYGYARALEVLEASPDRAEPPCPVSRQCGGCTLQAMSYAAQLRFKEKKVADALERIGGFKIQRSGEREEAVERECGENTGEDAVIIEPIVGMENPARSRNKAQYPVGIDVDKKPAIGFYAGRSHRIVPLPGLDCLIGQEINKEILAVVLAHMEKLGIAPYDEETGRGLVRHVLIRVSHASGEIMVCIVINGDNMPGEEALAERLFEIPGMACFCLNINKKNTNVILGEGERIVRGQEYITDKIGEFSFRIYPKSFFQVNPIQTKRLYDTVLEFAGLQGEETVWDLYCGAGTISLFLAAAVTERGKVYGIESVPEAVHAARENAKLNGITNAEFFSGKAEDLLPDDDGKRKQPASIAKMKQSHPDLIVVDPPRKGCDAEVLRTIISAAPGKVVYVSCNPSTLARDLRILADGGYKVKKARPVDMFVFSTHVECVVLLSRA